MHARLWDDMPVAPVEGVSIAEIMPNPFGSDTNREFVRLANATNRRVQLRGWRLRDSDGNTFDLNRFFVNRRSSFQIQLRDTDMSLDNDVDTVELVDDRGGVVDEFSYDADDVTVGQVLTRR